MTYRLNGSLATSGHHAYSACRFNMSYRPQQSIPAPIGAIADKLRTEVISDQPAAATASQTVHRPRERGGKRERARVSTV
jgi:hypothetical protein